MVPLFLANSNNLQRGSFNSIYTVQIEASGIRSIIFLV
jgi:hypothetical protein